MGKKSKANPKKNTKSVGVSSTATATATATESKLPFVSVICVTYNRRPFFPVFFECIRNQTYPTSRFEVILVDDGTDKIADLVLEAQKTIPNLKYFAVAEKMTLGKKRNYSHTLCSPHTVYVTYFDDDDYAHPERIRHSVEMLEKNPQAMAAGSSELYVYFKHIQKMYQFGPYGPNHATAGTFMFRKSLLDNSHYEDTACLAEEKYFLKNYTVPFVQLNPLKCILVFSHEHNTFDKRKLLAQAPNPYCKESKRPIEEFITLPKESWIKQFFLHDIDKLLEEYEPGLPIHKPDVLKQTQEIEEERAKMMAAQQAQQQTQAQGQILLQRPGQEQPVALTTEQVVQLLQQQQSQIEQMGRYIQALESKLRSILPPPPPVPAIA